MKSDTPKRKPVVGETLYSLNVGNAAFQSAKQYLTPVVVIAVKNKYFTAAYADRPHVKHLHRQYYIENWYQKSDYSPTSELYETPQEWKDKKESDAIRDKLSEAFRYPGTVGKVSLDQLRRINAILEEK